jgi:hypothetical protein
MIDKNRLKARGSSLAVMRFDDRGFTKGMTTEDRVLQIQALRLQIDGHADFMCSDDRLKDSSPESRETAMAAFHECLARREQELALIRESLQLA